MTPANPMPPDGMFRGNPTENRRRIGEDRGGGFAVPGARRGRPEGEAYAGPQLTPPGPLAPLVPEAPRLNRDERRRQLQPTGAFRGDPAENRRQFDERNGGGGDHRFRGRRGGEGAPGESERSGEGRGRRGGDRPD